MQSEDIEKTFLLCKEEEKTFSSYTWALSSLFINQLFQTITLWTGFAL